MPTYQQMLDQQRNDSRFQTNPGSAQGADGSWSIGGNPATSYNPSTYMGGPSANTGGGWGDVYGRMGNASYSPPTTSPTPVPQGGTYNPSFNSTLGSLYNGGDSMSRQSSTGYNGSSSMPRVSSDSTANFPSIMGGASTLGGMAGGLSGASSGGQSISNPSTPNYPLNVGAYLNPSMDFTMQQGLKALGNTYGAQGNFLSGPAMKGITDYSQGVASQNWNNAANLAGQQQAFGYGVNNNDRNFAYNAQLNDQTIPFDQQVRLAQMGLQGAGIGANQNNAQAAIQSNNILSGAQAGATGSIGQGNALANMISQWIQNYMGGQYMNQVFPRPGG